MDNKFTRKNYPMAKIENTYTEQDKEISNRQVKKLTTFEKLLFLSIQPFTCTALPVQTKTHASTSKVIVLIQQLRGADS